uniref:Coiled-coil domain-containing protein 9 n=1 Tax=Strigamia maritima TaxID=126957 RepID=T1IP61_STRMM
MRSSLLEVVSADHHLLTINMAEVTDDNREAKEAYLDSKMEKIRQRNRELQQRYLEIEADKQNAEENSNAALAKQLAQDGTVEKTTRNIARSTTRSTAPKPRKPKPDSPNNSGVGGRDGDGGGGRAGDTGGQDPCSNDQSRRQQRLSEDENPPPDPSYNFLFDRLRVGIENDEQRIQSRRHPSNYGGQDFSNVKNTIQIRRRHEREHPRGPPRNKMEMSLTMTGHERTQYEEWKRVQDQCDKERLARQKTASGEWRREWDRDKIIQEYNDF